MKRLVIGILAHVDAGKTTLSESMLYLTGKIRSLGRVDNQNAYLDTHELEKQRGITIFSKQAVFRLGDDTHVTLLDTPGHMDFSLEMERTLHILDYAILVISGIDGVQGHTKTLWQLLDHYKIPTFIFINKMDLKRTKKAQLLKQLQQQLSHGCCDFEGMKVTRKSELLEWKSNIGSDDFYQRLALSDEQMLESYIETEHIQQKTIRNAISKRDIFPCFFGSALKVQGVEQFLQGILEYTIPPTYPSQFGARIFKVSRDEQGNRLTHLKISGGSIKVKDILTNGIWEEKVNQIRIYSGDRYESVDEISAGAVCAVTGLNKAKPGEGLGIEGNLKGSVIEPVLVYRIILPEDCSPIEIIPKLRLLEEEEPELKILWDEQLEEIQAQIMGQIQIEILESRIKDNFGIRVQFDTGKILYKETIANVVEGVGHYGSLGRWAEVHLLLEPSSEGSGLKFTTDCNTGLLTENWQSLILSHLQAWVPKGILTGSPVTDMKITLVSGRIQGSRIGSKDIREATYRALRQGLKEAKSVLLEPYFSFQLEVPEKVIGRALADVERMHGSCEISQAKGGTAIITGSCPVITMQNYQQEVMAYTSGLGRLACFVSGYCPCHNPKEVMVNLGYDWETDLGNPTGSIFFREGASFSVDWYDVKDHMYLPSYFQAKIEPFDKPNYKVSVRNREESLGTRDYDFLSQAVNANKGKKVSWKKYKEKELLDPKAIAGFIGSRPKTKYLLVDGYNVIHAWSELKQISKNNMDGARQRLLNILASYQGMKGCQIIVVFDAYRVAREGEDIEDFHNIKVVYTKESQTADEFIERFSYAQKKEYDITVATSDRLQQIIVNTSGSSLMPAEELILEIKSLLENVREDYGKGQELTQNFINGSLLKEID